MQTRLRGLMLTVLIIISLIPMASLSESPFSNASQVTMYLLAVGEEGGKYFGVPTRLNVIVTNGTGVVYLSTEPLAEVDMQASARLAALIASYVTGKNFYDYDYFISIKSNSTIVGGPSAGAAMTVAIAAALLHVKPNESVVETGMIMPDGTIGPVGGIPEKLQAAAEVHAKVMLIPAGQHIAYSLSLGRYVDVEQLGRKMGVKVVEVSTIYDALRWFGVSVSEPPEGNTSLSGKAVEVIKSWISESEETYNTYIKKAESLVLRMQEGSGLVSAYIKGARASYERGLKDVKLGKYYSAASDLFGAAINASTAYWLAEIISGGKTYGDLLSEVRDEVKKALETYSQVRNDALSSGDVEKLSIAVEVASRAMEANSSMNELPSQPASPSDIYEASYTFLRARSVIDWAKMYYAIPSAGLSVAPSELAKDVSLLVYFARTTVSYIESLIGTQVGSVSNVMQLVEEAEAYREKDLIASLAAALRASATSAALLNTAFTTDIHGTAERLRNVSLRGLGEAYAVGFIPIVASSYVERGDTLRGVDDVTAIYFYDLALVNTMWYMIISGARARSSLTTTSSPTPTPAEIPAPPTTSVPTSSTKTSTTTTPLISTGKGVGGISIDVVVDAVIILASIVAGFALGVATRRKSG